MRTTLLCCFISVGCWISASAATLPHYINKGPVLRSDPIPQIDAVSFENRNLFSLFTLRPYETFNTLNVTNTASGTMENFSSGGLSGFVSGFSSGSGFWFDHSYLGGRSPLANWVNRGLVSGFSHVWVESTNIVNAGSGIGVGARGVVYLSGDTVNLSRSGLYTGNRFGTPSGVTYFTTDTSSYEPNASGFASGSLKDLYWGIGSNGIPTADLGPSLTLPNPSTPNHRVTGIIPGATGFSNRFNFFQSLPNSSFFFTSNSFQLLSNYTALVYTNTLPLVAGQPVTNVIQVAFIPTNGVSQGVNIDVRWFPNRENDGSEVGWGFGNTAVVEMSLGDYDPVGQVSFTNYLYLLDYLAFQTTNRSLIPNVGSALTPGASTRRPNTYEVSRTDSQLFSLGFLNASNFDYDPALLSSGSYLSNRLQLTYAAYSVRLVLGQNLLSAQSSFPPGDVGWSGLPINDITNLAGRIEIKAKKLNMDNVRVHAQSGLIIKADDLVGNKLPIVNAPLLSYDLKTTQPSLVVSNLVATNVNRLIGDISAYSAIWQNGITNTTETNLYFFHVLFLDHSLSLTQSVVLQDLKLRGTNIVIADKLRVARNFLIETPNLTVTPTGVFTNGTQFDIGATNLLGLLNFTNRGIFAATRELRMGSDGSSALRNIVNYGTISGSSVDLDAGLLINSNLIVATTASVGLESDDLRLLGGSSVRSLGPTILSGKNLSASNSVIAAGTGTAGGHLVLSFTEGVKDGGVGTSNIWVTSDGFTFANYAPTGNLLYTTIISTATNQNEVIHYVGGRDLGVKPEGYTNNMALGRLVLDGSTNTVFRFSPPAGVSGVALYVDYLELRNFATNYQDSIIVDEGCRLYFADSSVGTKKVSHSSEDRVQWVSTYADGPNSSTNFVYLTVTNYINVGLALAPDIDSDNDGLDNFSDTVPLWTSEHALTGPYVTLTTFTNRQIVTVSGLALSSYDNGTYTNNAINRLYRFDPLNGALTFVTNFITPVVTTAPTPGVPLSVPFVFYDLGATNLGAATSYKMITEVSEP